MPERRQIKRRAVHQMVRLVTALIWILLATLCHLAFLILTAAMSLLAGMISNKGGCFEPSSGIHFQFLEWCLRDRLGRCPTRLKATIQIARIRSPGIANNRRQRRRLFQGIWWRQVLAKRATSSLVAREGSPDVRLRQLLEPGATTSTGDASQLVQEAQTTRSEEIISNGGRTRPLDITSYARRNLERKLREELRQLEGEMSEKLKLEEKGKKRMEEEEEEETMEED